MLHRIKTSAIAMAVILAILFVCNTMLSVTVNTPRIADLERLPVIVIDPGHGGIDGGAVSSDRVLEKDINLAIALNLRDLFLSCGFSVVMTRDDDRSIHDDGVSGIKRQKTSDLKNRLEIIKECGPNTIFLSIHQNKYSGESSHGAQIFYSPNHGDSMRLAQLLQDKIVELLQPDNNRKIKKAEQGLYLMTEAQCPAVLVECGFLSNIRDTMDLQSPAYRAKLSFAVLAAVLDYLDMELPRENAAEREKAWQSQGQFMFVQNADMNPAGGMVNARIAASGTA